jgi:hypothetical protein
MTHPVTLQWRPRSIGLIAVKNVRFHWRRHSRLPGDVAEKFARLYNRRDRHFEYRVKP